MIDLGTILERLGRPRLLVVGDLMLDRYTWGAAERICPEAPVPVLHVERQEIRPGGAAAVACLARGLDAEVCLAGVVGDDDDGCRLGRLLVEAGVYEAAVLALPDRPTTVKERFLGRAGGEPQQLLRVDHEDRQALPPQVEDRLVDAAAELVEQCQAVLISDYAKGVCSPRLLRALTAVAARQHVPVLIDPARLTDYSRYRQADLLAPNRSETAAAVGRRIHTGDDALAAGQELCDRLGAAAVLVKLDKDGMALARRGEPGRLFPTRLRQVRDVAGAGDMVLAMVGLCRAGGLDWEQAVRLANVAAGLEVQRQGVAPVSRAEICADLRGGEPGGSKVVSLEEMAVLADGYRRLGRTLVLTNGCFDLLHAGHLRCLQEAAGTGDVLVVALNSDRSVRQLKGADRPVVGEAERAALVAALACVDYVLIFDGRTPHDLLSRLRPDVLVKGGTYTPAEVVGREVVEAYGGRICVTGKREDISTSTRVAALRAVPTRAGA